MLLKSWMETTAYKNDLHLLPKLLNELAAYLHLLALGAVLTVWTVIFGTGGVLESSTPVSYCQAPRTSVLVCSFVMTVGAKRFDCSDVFLRLVKMAYRNGLKYGELYGWSPSGRTTPYPSSFASSARRWSDMSTDQICAGPVYTSIINVPPPPTLHLCDAARTKHRYIHIRPEVVGWAPPV